MSPALSLPLALSWATNSCAPSSSRRSRLKAGDSQETAGKIGFLAFRAPFTSRIWLSLSSMVRAYSLTWTWEGGGWDGQAAPKTQQLWLFPSIYMPAHCLTAYEILSYPSPYLLLLIILEVSIIIILISQLKIITSFHCKKNKSFLYTFFPFLFRATHSFFPFLFRATHSHECFNVSE